MCVYLGLEPQGEYENPFDGKRGYVRGRLLTKSLDELTELARKVVAQFGDEDLAKTSQKLTRQLGPRWARGSEPWPVRWQGDK